MASIGSLSVKVGAQISEFNSAMNTVVREAQKTARQVEKEFKGLSTIGKGLSDAGTKLTIGLTAPLAALGGAAIKAAGDMEQTQVAFTTMLKSGQAAKSFLSDLQKFAASTPFEFTDLTAASRKMLALGFNAKEVIPTLTAVGNASSALGLGAQGVDRIVLALGQMRLKGRTTAEEMKQLTEAGIDAWGALAKALNTDVATAMKMVEKRMIDGKKTAEVILNEMGQTFKGGMEAQSKTLLGQWSNVLDQLKMSLAGFGLEVSKALDLKGKLAGLTELLQKFNELPESVKSNIVQIGLWTAALPLAVTAAGKLITSIKDIIKAYEALKAAQVFAWAGRLAVPAAAAVAVYEFGKMLIDHGQKPADQTAKALDNLNRKMRETGNLAVNWGKDGPQPLKNLKDRVFDFAASLPGAQKGTSNTKVPGLVNDDAAEAARKTRQEYEKLLNLLGANLQPTMAEMKRSLAAVTKEYHAGRISVDDYTKAIEKYTQAQWEAENPTLALQVALLKVDEQNRKLLDPLRQAHDELKEQSLVQVEVTNNMLLASPVYDAIIAKLLSMAQAATSAARANKSLELANSTLSSSLDQVKTTNKGLQDLGVTSSADLQKRYELAQKTYDAMLKQNEASKAEFYSQRDLIQAQYQLLLAKEKTVGLSLAEQDALRQAHVYLESMNRSVVDILEKTKKPLQEVSTILTNMNQRIGDAIVNWKGFGDTAVSILRSIGSAIISEIFSNLILTQKRIDSITKGIGGILSKIPGLGGVFGSAKSSTKTASDVIGGSSSAASAGASALASVGKAAAGVASGLASTLTAVGSIGSLVTGVISIFQNRGMSKDTGRIEENTRGTLVQLRDGIQPQINAFLPGITSIHERLMDFARYGLGVFPAVNSDWSFAGAGGGNNNALAGVTINIHYAGNKDVENFVDELIRVMRLRGIKI